MTFAAPWILLALAFLPLLWWLLRVTPPAPRRERFPAVRLLKELAPVEQATSRTPWWLLMLRLAAAALVIIGLADPVERAGSLPAGHGPLLLVVDNGWAAAADWSARMEAANAALDRIAREGRRVALLATAPGPAGAPLAIGPPMPPASLRARLAVLQPQPWPEDRAAAAVVLRRWHADSQGHGVVYIADRIATPDPRADRTFAAALARLGPVTEIADPRPSSFILLPPMTEPGPFGDNGAGNNGVGNNGAGDDGAGDEGGGGRLVARVAALPAPVRQSVSLLAEAPGGRILARFDVAIPPGASEGAAAVPLPLELANRLDALRLADSAQGGPGGSAGPATEAAGPSAAGIFLLDERYRRRPVGLASGDTADANLPFVGPLYYLSRALGPYADVREADLGQLLSDRLAVIVLADRVLPPGPETDALRAWVARGGLLVRFAGPLTAAHPDALLPVSLLAGERTLGGALTWGRPEHLAAFPRASPFAGLPVPANVTVERQVLAQPSVDLDAHTWARLDDGTPLVTSARLGAGRIVLFHVTANTAWSNLPLSGTFVAMLRRLVELSAGVAESPGQAILAPASVLDGLGAAEAPGPAARGLAADRFSATMPSPLHPPGLYGPENGRRALNLGAALPPPGLAPPVPGARLQALDGIARELHLGPPLIALAFALFAIDLLIALALRGLLARRPAAPRPPASRPPASRPAAHAAALLLLAFLAFPTPSRAELPADDPALITRLAYVVTGDQAVDDLSRSGLQGLSDFVNARTAATLGPPKAVVPGRDDLSFYPLLYWPVTTSEKAMSPDAVTALNRFMGNGGIILIDTEGSDANAPGSGAGFAPGVSAALQRLTRGLAIPALTPLTYENVLAHTFYLLRTFPGRFDGAPVWLASDPSNRNDNVSPVIIGAADWAAAWAVDADGQYPYAAIPGGDDQRLLAYRFGVNVVMYALTGNYKGDQVHLPAILERLGQ